MSIPARVVKDVALKFYWATITVFAFYYANKIKDSVTQSNKYDTWEYIEFTPESIKALSGQISSPLECYFRVYEGPRE